MSERIAKRLLMVGWDAADWRIIDTLFAHGGMPNLRRLVDKGVRANLASLEPRLSPLLWSSIATGKTPDKHGILNFVEPNPSGEGMRIISSTSRKTKALWNMLTQSDMRVNVVSWYASHPAEPINGACVSNLFQENMPATKDGPWPMPKGAVQPELLCGRIAEIRMHPSALAANALLPLIPNLKEEHLADHRVNMLAKNLAHCVSVHNAATSILTEDKAWDCTMVFYETIDTVGHNFMQYHPPKMAHVSAEDFELFNEVMYGVYQFHDMMLGTLLDLAGADTTVLLLSDHGFYSDHRRPVIQTQRMTADERALVEANWHRPFGVLVLEGPGIRKGQRIYGPSLLDITPTSLALLGLPIGADMGGRALTEAFDRPVTLDSVFSWDLVEGEAGMHPPDMRQDPFEARDALKQLVELGYMADLPEDSKAQSEVAWRESQCNLATVLTSSGQLSKAIEAFRELCRKYPDDSRYSLAMARCLSLYGQFDEAAGIVERYWTDRSDNVEIGLLLASCWAHTGKTSAAAELATMLEGKLAGRLDLSPAMGGLYNTLGSWKDAERHFLASIEHDPENAFAHHGLAMAMVAQERFEEAVDHSLRAIELVHFFPEAHFTLGLALVGMKDLDHAIKSFNVAVSMQPSHLDAHRWLATLHRHRDDRENAAKHREVGERIMRERAVGTMSVDFLKRQVPLGPQEWVSRVGSSQRDE